MEFSMSTVPFHLAAEDTSGPALIAYRTGLAHPCIEPAGAERTWMNETDVGFANRCLPLRIANQAGWVILNDHKVAVLWTGGNELQDVRVRHWKKRHEECDPKSMMRVISHFGHGIVTWQIPYLFRTPAGYDTYVRGPANWCKDGAAPLCAIVETDWAVATFTMNWKITRPGVLITFDEGEPICMISPQPRGTIESFYPMFRDLSTDPELEKQYAIWHEEREAFLKQKRTKSAWQKHYYVGKTPSGDSFTEHKVRLSLRSFRE